MCGRGWQNYCLTDEACVPLNIIWFCVKPAKPTSLCMPIIFNVLSQGVNFLRTVQAVNIFQIRAEQGAIILQLWQQKTVYASVEIRCNVKPAKSAIDCLIINFKLVLIKVRLFLIYVSNKVRLFLSYWRKKIPARVNR
jgi:hypothetical protein